MLKKIASLGVIQFLGLLVTLIRAKTFAVLLGPSGVGVIATIDQLVLSIVQITNLSLPFTALKFLSRSHSQGDQQFRRSYAAFAKAIVSITFIATITVVWAIPPRLDLVDSQIAQYRDAVTMALLGIPAATMMVFFSNVLAARQESSASVTLTVASTLVAFIAGLAGCLWGGISGIYVWAVSFSTVSAFAVSIYLWKRRDLSPWADSSGQWSEWISASQIIGITLIPLIAVASAAIQLLIARYAAIVHVSAEGAGILHSCLAIALSIGAVLGPANALYFSPFVNRSIPANEKVEAADRFLPRLVLLYCLGGVAVLLFPKFVLTTLFSGEFVPAVTVLPWFVAWQCLYQISNIYQQLLLGLDDVGGYSWASATGNLAAAAMCIVMVDRLGLLGIAIGFVVGALISLALTSIRLRSRHGLVIPRSCFGLIAFSMFGFGVVALLGQFTIEMSWLGALSRAITAIAFLAVLWLVLPFSLRMELSEGISRTWLGIVKFVRSVQK